MSASFKQFAIKTTRPRNRQYSWASTFFNRAIKLDPQHYNAHANRGLVRLQQRQEAEAQRDFNQCRRLNPNLRDLLEPRIQEVKAHLAFLR